MNEEGNRCVRCNKRIEDAQLARCPACFAWFCSECAVPQGGQTFCSRECGRYFFFEDEDE
jgi:hypothetical protein